MTAATDRVPTSPPSEAGSPAVARSRPRRLVDAIRDPVVVACLVNLAFGAWILGLLPVFTQADEAFHFAAILTVSDGDGWPATAADLERERLPRQVANLRGQWDGDYTVESAPNAVLPAAGTTRAAVIDGCRVEPGSCPTRLPLTDWGQGSTAAANRAVQHPPFYYTLTGLLGTFAAGLVPVLFGLEGGQAVLLMRLLTVLAITPVPLLAARLARELSLGRTAEVTAAAATMAIPGLYYTSSVSVSPDALLIVLASWATLLVARITASPTPRDLVVLGGVLGLTAFTKSPGLLVVVAAGLVLAPTLLADGWREAARRLLLVGVPAFVMGGWWWVRNLVVIGSLQPLLNNPPDPRPTELTRVVVTDATLTWAERSMRAFWGLFMIRRRTEQPVLFWLVVAALVIAVLGAVFLLGSRRMGMFSVVMIGGTVTMVWLTMLARLSSLGAIRAVQGRYLYPSIVLLAVGLAAIATRWTGRWRPARAIVPLVVAAGVVAWQGRAFLVWMRRFGDSTEVSDRVRAWIAWYPGPDWAAVVTALALVGLLAYWITTIAIDPYRKTLEA